MHGRDCGASEGVQGQAFHPGDRCRVQWPQIVRLRFPKPDNFEFQMIVDRREGDDQIQFTEEFAASQKKRSELVECFTATYPRRDLSGSCALALK